MANPLHLKVVLESLDKATGPINDIVRSSKGLQRAFVANAEAVKKLKIEQRDINGYRQQETALSRTSNALVQQRNELKAMKAALDATEKPTAKLTKAFELQLNAVKTLAGKHHTQRNELAQTRTKLREAGIETSRLAVHEKQLASNISKANDKLKVQQQRLLQVGEAAERAKKMHSGGMVAGAHGAALAYGGVRAMQGVGAAMQPGLELEARMRDISITGGLDRGQEAKLSAQVRADAMTFGQTTELISQGLGTLVANGITAQQDLSRYSGMLAKSSVASGAEVEDLSNLIVSLQRNLGLTSGQVSGALDSLAYAGKEGSFELRDMAKWMPQLAPMMAGLGVTGREAVDQLGAALQVARLGAGTSDEAANNLKNYLSKVVSQDTIGNFDKVGIDLKKRLLQLQAQGVNPLQGSLRLITEYMGKKGPEATKKLQAAMAIKDQEQQQAALAQLSSAYALGELFRDQQALAFIRPALMNAPEMQRIQQGASGANGALDRDYANRDDTAGRGIDRLKIALSELKQQAFDILKANIGEWAHQLSDGMQRFSQFAKDHPQFVGAMVKLGVLVAIAAVAMGSLLMVGGGVAMALGNILSVATKIGASALFSGIGGVGLASIAAPLLLIASIGLLIWKYWEPIKAFLGGMWDGFLDGIQPIMPVLGMLADTLKQILAPADASKQTLAGFASAGKAVGTVLGWVVSAVVIPLGLALKGLAIVFEWVGTQIGNFIGFIVTGLGQAWDLITGVFSGDWSQVMAALRGLWDNINQFFGGLPAKLLQIGIDMVMGLVNGIKSMYGAAKAAIGGLGSSIINFFTGPKQMDIHSPSRTFARFGMFTMQGFTQGLLGGQGDAQAALGRIGDGLRKTGAGIALGTLAAPALAAPVPLLAPPAAQVAQTIPAPLPTLTQHITPQLGALPVLQTSIQTQLDALPALPAMTLHVTPQLAAMPVLQAQLRATQDAPQAQTLPSIDRRPPLASGARGGAGSSMSATYNITINASASQNPQDIAALVRQEIERIQHRQRVRTRSELSDYE